MYYPSIVIYHFIHFTFFISNTLGHLFMSFPPSRRNKYSDYYLTNHLVDYNIMAPLNTNGYTFPCKGFPVGPPTQIFNSNTITITLEGSAIHGGGHCQFGITYDDTHFLVLKTVIRNCLLDTMTYQFTLPSNTPSGNLTLFWTWVNAIGNREYYMECADIQFVNNNNNGNVSDRSNVIYGKELIIVDLPGYSSLPEFPNIDMYDGRELFINAKSYYITPPDTNPQPPPDTNTQSPPDTNPQSQPDTNLQYPPDTNPQSPPDTNPQSPPDTNLQYPPDTNLQPPADTNQPPPDTNPQSPDTNPQPPPITSITSITSISQDSKCDILGYMRCNGKNFDTCVYGSWLTRGCAPGTKCKDIQNGNIICDFV